MRDLYDKNFKSLKKEIKVLRIWRYLPCSWTHRINKVKMAIPSKAIYSFNTIPIKCPKQFFKDLETAILKFFWKNKKSRIVKTIFNNERTCAGITIHDLKLYYRTIMMKKLHGIGTETDMLINGIELKTPKLKKNKQKS